MRCFWDDRQRLHAPGQEFFNGALSAHAENVGRPESILAAIGASEPPRDHGEEPLLRVHRRDYLDFLKSAHAGWIAAGRSGDAIPYTFPIVRRRPLAFDRIDASLGQYAFDTSTPIGEGTWTAACWAAYTALSALDRVIAGDRGAFALCRPPGHHAGADYLGGYCYLNNAAIAAEAAIAAGRRRVAILDVDYHHGNGTQDIFYARGDVFFASIHADPVTDYPFFWGHADETGEGPGEGATLNLPLQRGARFGEYRTALDAALAHISRFAPGLLILSFGADTFSGDPISHFAIETGEYPVMAGRIAALGLPTLIVMEGGYAVAALGENVAAFLEGFA
jgi:acetoin utilization deacetylase AcuC-like enzyme